MCEGKGMLANRENFGHIVECGCGSIHVTIGPVSVALDSQALRTLHEMIGQAIEHQDTSAEESAHRHPLLMHSSHLAVKKVMRLKH
ncbi:MAG TPA: hypothetical protein VMH89_11460 [Candidatus Acidoferrum sp.]|nr:hypothetical protein [Candidatus Acidoferrum sp.]